MKPIDSRSPPALSSGLASRDPATVLIVDDEPENRRLLRALIEEEGHATCCAKDGLEAIERIEDGAVDAILLDMMMPKLDGIEVVRRLRMRGHDLLPIIMVTAASQPERRREALQAGADDFLVKPIDRVEMVTRLRNLLHIRRLHQRLRKRNRSLRRREASARKREVELKASLAEYLPIVFFEITMPGPEYADFKLEWVSSNVETLLGVEPQALMSQQSSLDLIHPDDHLTAMTELEELHRGGCDSCSVELRWRGIDDDERWLLVGGSVTERSQDETAHSVVAFALDITEQRRLAEQLAQAAKLEAVGELAAGLAHDFNNMLTVIHSNAEFIEDDSDGQSREDAGEILEATRRARKLTTDLLSFSRNQAVEPSAESLDSIVRGLLDMMRRLAGPNIRLSVDCDCAEDQVVAPVSEVERVIVNLVTNARDAMPDGGKLSLRTRRTQVDRSRPVGDLEPGEYLVLEVEDTGEGMDEDTVERVFEPFFTTKRKGEGTGLGLATAYGVVRQAGGHIVVDSKVGEGTRFELYFPLADQDVLDTLDSLDALESSMGEADRGPSSGRILVVDDAPMLRKAMVRMLHHYGYEVVGASNGRDALECVEAEPDAFALVISDVSMPEMGGIELGLALAETCPGIQLIFTSSFAFPEEVAHVRQLSEDRLLQKPFEFDDLLELTRQCVEEGG